MAKLYKQPFHLPKTYYRAIGEVIARTALFDYHLMIAIGHLLRINNSKQVRVSFLGMAAKARMGTLKALAINWSPHPRIKQELCSIISAALKLSKVRNSLAHGVWGYDKSPRTLSVIFAEEKKDFYMPLAKHYKSAEVLAKAKEILALDKRLVSVIKKLQALPSP